MARVRKVLLSGATLPPDAPRDELMAYHRMSADIAKENLRVRAELDKRRQVADESSARRQALSEASSGYKYPYSRPSKLEDMQQIDRHAVTKNLDDSFKMVIDDDGNQIPTTPAEALLAAQTYLQCS